MADILVVEDEIAIAEALLALFEDQGHRVRAAPNGRAGLEAAAERRPDLVLTDTTMPVMAGPDMVASLLDDHAFAAIPVVVMSAMLEGEIRPTYRRCTAFIQKPFRVHEVAALIERALRGVRS